MCLEDQVALRVEQTGKDTPTGVVNEWERKQALKGPCLPGSGLQILFPGEEEPLREK